MSRTLVRMTASVMTLRSGIIAIKTFHVGDSIGYGADIFVSEPRA